LSPKGERRATTRLRPPAPLWREPARPAQTLVEELAAGTRLPSALCSVLAARDVASVDEAKRFLRPRLEYLHDPSTMADGVRAAERIARAVRAGERIFVHGDYDVDGICATALYTRWLRGLGGHVSPFTPHRLRDGYDFSAAGLAAARDAKATLIVTADCGTLAHSTIRSTRELDIDVIVTDHHTVGAELPEAFAVVNPRRPDCPYPEKGLCGTGIAYKVCQLVGDVLGADRGKLDAYMDLVALATIADLVPLVGENRVLVAYGLRRLAASSLPGVRALLTVSDVAPTDVTAGKVGFVLAPRINAAGRLGDSADALRLLLTEDQGEAGSLAEALDRTNRARQEEDTRTLDEALGQLEESFDADADFGVVLASEGWHPGVIGIVASRVVEAVHRPAVLIALAGDSGRGSARSIPGLHLFEALSDCAQHLRRFGGHRQAAGMDLSRDELPAFRQAFNAAARARLSPEDLRPALRPDVELDLAVVDADLAHWLSYLGPHGIGNPGPMFLTRGVALERPKVVGERHLKVSLAAGGSRLDAIGFGLAERYEPATLASDHFDVLFRLELNEWQGVSRPQAKLVDLRPTVS